MESSCGGIAGDTATGSDSGIAGELLRDSALFLAMSIGLGVPYAVAVHLRGDRPRVAALVVLLSFIPLFVLSMIAATAV